jgi:hypothetical protein
MTSVSLIFLHVFVYLIHHQHALILLHNRRSAHRIVMKAFKERPKMEFWLDLRGTQLSPQDTQRQLEQEFGDYITSDSENRSLVTRIILNKVANYDGTLPANAILVHEDNQIMSDSLDGIISSLHPSGMVANPLLVIDTISQGRWVVIQSPGQTSPPLDSLFHLVSLVSSVATPGAGVAWPCRTSEDVWEACRNVLFNPLCSISREGILLPTQDSRTDSALQWALILPWDIKLWESAVTLMQDDSF